MPVCIFGSTSENFFNILDTSSFVQKPFLRTKIFESNIEEDIEEKSI